VSILYICRGSRPILPNVDTSSAGWIAPVIAFLYTLSTHHHLSYLYYYFSLHHHLSKFFFFLFQKLSNKAYIFFLSMHDTPTRKVISSLFNAGISFMEQ
jgi:hypothetical protein